MIYIKGCSACFSSLIFRSLIHFEFIFVCVRECSNFILLHVAAQFSHFSRGPADGQWAPEKMLNIANHQGNAKSKPQWDVTSHLSECLSLKRTQATDVGKDVGKKWILILLLGMEIGVATVENRMEVSQKKLNKGLLYDPEFPLLGRYLRQRGGQKC